MVEGGPPPRPDNRLERALGSGWTLAAILGLAAALRLGHLLAIRSLPLFDRLIIDAEFYDRWARRLAAGDWLDGHRPFFFDPLYPYFLAALYRLFGHELVAVHLVQVALGVGTCALAAVIGRRTSGGLVGNLAALLLAIHGPAIFEEGEIEKTALGVFLATAALALAMFRSPLARFGCGAAAGLAALARGNMLLLLPAGALYILFSDVGGLSGLRPHWRSARGALAFVAGACLALAPAAWRNHRVSGEWVVTTAGGGPNLYIGNNPWNATGGYQYLPWIRPQSEHEESDWRAETERRLGRSVPAAEVSRYWFSQALDHVTRNPGMAAAVAVRKAALLAADRELGDGWSIYFVSRFSPVLRMPLISMAILLPLAALGAVVGIRRPEIRLLAGYALLYLGTLVAFWVFSRFRLYAIPAMAVLAASAVPWIRDAIRARSGRRLGFAGLVTGANLILSLAVGPVVLGPLDPGQNFSNLAGLYMEVGEPARAVAVLQDGLAASPGRVAVLFRLGEVSMRLGRPDEAIRHLEECVSRRPTYPDAWYWLGHAHAAAGHRAEAAMAFQRQLALVPGHEHAARDYAALMAR